MSPRTKAAVQVAVDGRQLIAREGDHPRRGAARGSTSALCHPRGIATWGACRLCLVGLLEGLDKLQAACAACHERPGA